MNDYKDYKLKGKVHAPLKPHAGQIFIFPAWLLHEVYPFRGKGLRRTISFNLSFEM